jgi:hypothetical protein
MKYLAYDGINNEHEECDTIEEAREYLEESFLQENEYHPDLESCSIWEIKETVEYDVIDELKDSEFDEIWKHRFEPTKNANTTKNNNKLVIADVSKQRELLISFLFDFVAGDKQAPIDEWADSFLARNKGNL